MRPTLEPGRPRPASFTVGLFALFGSVVTIGALSAFAAVTGDPSMFPSLGPTAFLIFSSPTAASSSPRNALAGHLIGCAAGYAALVAFGLTHAGPALADGFTWARAGAAALSLGLTSGLMIWLGVPHAPAGATTLIVSLGILSRPWQLGFLMLSVAVLVALGFVLSWLAGVDYPRWSPRARPVESGGKP